MARWTEAIEVHMGHLINGPFLYFVKNSLRMMELLADDSACSKLIGVKHVLHFDTIRVQTQTRCSDASKLHPYSEDFRASLDFEDSRSLGVEDSRSHI